MDRITDDAWCSEVRCDSYVECYDTECLTRRVWERLKALEDRLGDDYLLDDACSRSDIRQWIYEAICTKCACELHGDRGPDGCFGCKAELILRWIGGQA